MTGVLFLDFDGVLNSIEMLPQASPGCSRQICGRPGNYDQINPCGCVEVVKQFDRRAIALLNELLRQTDAAIVFSTSWRKLYDIESLTHILEECGFEGRVIGETPDLINDEAWKITTRGERWIDRIQRGHEIGEWLLQHPEVTRCVILDDSRDMWHLAFCFVQTNENVGLTSMDVERAIAALEASAEPLASFRRDLAP